MDSFVFDPCGFSLNGLYKDYYWTIHVTPEDSCSYASFETTIPISSSLAVSPLVSSFEKERPRDSKTFVEESRYSNFESLMEVVVSCFGATGITMTLFTGGSRDSLTCNSISNSNPSSLLSSFPSLGPKISILPTLIQPSPPSSPLLGENQLVGRKEMELGKEKEKLGSDSTSKVNQSLPLIHPTMPGFTNKDWLACQVGEWDLLYGHWVKIKEIESDFVCSESQKV